MRMTLMLDDDVAAALREQARLKEQSFKQVVNDTLRRGLSPGPVDTGPSYEVRPHLSGFRPGVDPLRLNQLHDSLAAAAVGGNLVTDAHIAALAVEHQAEAH